MLTLPGEAASIRSLGARLATLLLGLATASCVSSRVGPPTPLAAPARSATLDEVAAAYDEYCSGIWTFSASGSLEVRDARSGKSGKLGVRLVAARGGRLYIKGSVLVVTALEVVSNGDRFWFQVPSKKTVWTGPNDLPAPAEGSDNAPYYALRPRDVSGALLPEPLKPGADDVLLLEADRDAFSLLLGHAAAGRGSVARRVWMDRATLKPVRLREYDERGEVSSEVSLGQWQEGTPRQLVVSRPREGYLATLSLDKVETNVSVPDRAFVPRTPEDYKVEEVRD